MFRAFTGAAALLASTSLSARVLGQGNILAEPFSFDELTDRMRMLAQAAYAPEFAALPEFVKGLDYDGYRHIQFRPDHAFPLSSAGGYQVQGFHLGWLFNEPVKLFEVDRGIAQPIVFSADDFDYFDEAVIPPNAGDSLPGVAGFRINYPVNQPDKLDELLSFLGASYFRALGRDSVYGASARGVALNSWVEGPEEFPRFSAFYLQKTEPGAPLMVVAALEGPSLTGAYRFEITPANEQSRETLIEVTARLFFRADIGELGIAPLTSMFLFAEGNRSNFDDYRPQVHDSSGLSIVRESGEVLWRALNNPVALANSYFTETNPRAFGLLQRDRDFETYQDAGAHYERRPSILIEPQSEWGTGSIRLIEIPSKLEAEDNIVVFWVPEKNFAAGSEAEFKYRLRWGDVLPNDKGEIAYVAETRAGQGGVSGVENATTLRKFVIDFVGGPLADLDPESELEAVAEVSGGTLLHAAVSRIEANGAWRLALDVEIASTDPVELRAHVVGMGRQLTETWLYQWRATA